MTITITDAIIALHPNNSFILRNGYENIEWVNPPENPATLEQVNNKLTELHAAYPMRLLREERNRRLQETDWEMMRNAERDINNDELIKYRNDLRDLPALVEDQMTVDESNRNSALVPTIENGQLVFESWPTKPE